MNEIKTILANLPSEWRETLASPEKPSLSSGPGNPVLAGLLKKPVADPPPKACMAGLWLLAGDLDRSHQISQDDPSPEGSFWHGIMHRREGDFSNAKYWFRRVGKHPVIERLQSHSPKLYNDPYQFIDRVEAAVRNQVDAPELVELQWFEWCWLMEHCMGAS